MRKGTFGNSADIFTCAQGIANFSRGRKFPLFLCIQTVGLVAALQKPACLLRKYG